MAIKLGTSSVTLKLGTQSVTGYLGSAIVTATVPGAPINVQANEGGCEDPGGCFTQVSWGPPSSDGGSPITEYRIYDVFDNSLTLTVGPTETEAQVTGGLCGFGVEVSAVNAVGEGPRVAADPCNQF
jgi:hypothetical protein